MKKENSNILDVVGLGGNVKSKLKYDIPKNVKIHETEEQIEDYKSGGYKLFGYILDNGIVISCYEGIYIKHDSYRDYQKYLQDVFHAEHRKVSGYSMNADNGDSHVANNITDANTNQKVGLLRRMALSFNNDKVYIPDNESGVSEGYHKIKDLLYFMADMIEE